MALAPFDDITAIYTSFHAWSYEAIVAPAVYQSRHVIDERFLPYLPEHAHILDVGCGGGKFTKYVADQRPDATVIGIDLARPQLDRAAKLLRGYGDRVRIESGDATSLAFGDNTFDGVLSYGSIKHWTNRDIGLAECLRVLKPAGPLLVTDADRSATFEDCQSFIANYSTPGFLGGPNLAFFRTWIAGRSLDLDDLRDLASRVELADKDVSRIPDFPLLMLSGRKPE
jgi:ubiquinone/menaquinone biosynthesis C-methylase UbiE